MQDDPSNLELEGLISIAQYPDIRDWCSHLGCTEVELAEAIAVVGYSPESGAIVSREEGTEARRLTSTS